MSTPDPGLPEAVLARNDRYLREFVEALGICPFARRCREGGKLVRRVVWDPDRALEEIREVERLPADGVEVALLIFPAVRADGPDSAQEWEHAAAALRAQLGPDPAFYCVAFHPDLPRDTADAGRAVHLLRRSPDPTLQLVRASLLRQVRAGREGGSAWLDPRTSLETLLAMQVPLDLSGSIAQANLETIRREGVDRVEDLLRSFREDAG